MGKYDSLREHLGHHRSPSWRATFEDVAALVPGGLQPSAYAYSAGWSNHQGHSQAVAWLDVGWRIENAELVGRTVVFVRLP